MGTNRIELIAGMTQNYVIDITDENGNIIPARKLVGASAEMQMKVNPSDVDNVLDFTTADATHMSFNANGTLNLSFLPDDTNTLPLMTYQYQVIVTLTDGTVFTVIQWTPIDLSLGGTTAPVVPPFTNTVKIWEDYNYPDTLRYLAPDGTPIANAQIRLYLKSDYDCGNLESPVGISMTNKFGRWMQPILVSPGYAYTVQFFLPNAFGPDIAQIIA